MVNETFCASWNISIASRCCRLSGLLNVIKISLSVVNGLLSCINGITCGINLIVNVSSSSRFYCLIVVSNFLIDLFSLTLVISVNLVQVLIVSSAQVTGLALVVSIFLSSLMSLLCWCRNLSYSSINCLLSSLFSSLFSSSICSNLLIDFCLMVSSCCL